MKRRTEPIVNGHLAFLAVRTAMVLLVMMLLSAYPTEGRENRGGSRTAEFLRLGTGAEAPALGDVMTARAEGVGALHYNPAGLGRTRQAEVEAGYHALGLGIHHGNIGYVRPVNDHSAWGIGINYVDFGNIGRTTISTAGGVVGTARGEFGANDISLGFSYGASRSSFSWGATAKVIHSSIASVTATSAALDLGAAWRYPLRPLTVGVVIRNLGNGQRFDREKSELPTLGRVGLSYEIFPGKWFLSADLEKVVDEEVRYMAGSEYRVVDFFAIRTGYDGRIDIDDGFTMGFGIFVREFEADYAYIPFGVAGNSHRLAIKLSLPSR